MEVLIGFAVGYWVGTRQGREGLERTVDTIREIARSPETRRLLYALRDADTLRKDPRGALIRGVLDEVIERRSEHRSRRPATHAA